MSPRTDLYDLLFSYVRLYDDEVMPFAEFAAVWCEGIGVQEVAKRLGANPESARKCRLATVVDDLEMNVGDGLLLVGPAGAWTLALQVAGYDCTLEENISRLSDGGGRALSISWCFKGNTDLIYAVDGEIVTRFEITYPEPQSGSAPDALDPLMEGLRFQLDEDDPIVEESLNSAFVLAGRITGQEIDRTWLDSPHTRFVIPHS
ncbi:DUF6461 domain-containing protein [Streptosporangium sp. NPDC051023]|uniref:DUF6461 domain-containing protein n=1 Tax=Streptosporangium sp. NPDC051023 TaxID=3155410 RepID=UPI00344FC42A